jgi:hypothetical protein
MAKITKNIAERWLANVPDEVVFRCRNGRTMRNLRELEHSLAGMADETFAYHTTEGRSDFSRWVRDIFGDEKLAKDLEKSLDREQATKAVSSRIAFLESKLA